MASRSITARTVRIAAQTALGFACGFALYPAMANAETVPAKTPARAAATVSMDRIVCVRETTLDTRIARKVCKTRGEWIEQTGIDPLNVKYLRERRRGSPPPARSRFMPAAVR